MPEKASNPGTITRRSKPAASLRLAVWVTALVSVAPIAQAAISVPTIRPLTFDAPVVAADWATLPVTGDYTTYADANGLDAGVQALTAATLLAYGAPHEETAYGNHAGARHNATAATLFTRPKIYAATLLMAILQNDTGLEMNQFTIAYDFSNGRVTAEPIVGLRAYYSLDGQANNWVVIPELCTGMAGKLSATVELTGMWPAGGTLYLLWADDNGTGLTDGYYAIDNLTVAPPPAPPVIVIQPAAETTVLQARPFTLEVAATGSPLYCQWYKQGVGPISGAGRRTYSATIAGLADAGNYYCVVTNILGSDTSTLAHVTVNRDTTPPAVVRAFAYPTFDPATQWANQDRVVVEFNERMDLGQATDSANYFLSDGTHDYPVGTAVLTNDGMTVVLTTASMFENTPMTLQMTFLRDWSGNEMHQTNMSFRSWVSSPANGLWFEVFNLVDPNTVNTIAFFTNSPNYPNRPDLQAQMWAFDSRIAYADDTHEHYGSRTRGLFIPPCSGNWRFHVRSDDDSQLFLNPNGPNASGKVLVVEEPASIAEWTGSGGDWSKNVSAPIALQAGQGYYVEVLHKEGTGRDYVKVAARLDGMEPLGKGGVDISIDTNALAGAAVCAVLAPADIGGALTLVGPGDLNLEEYQVATFTVAASNPSGLPMFYQWRRNGMDILGATGPTYSLRPTLTDDGAVFSVQVSRIGSVAVSRDARLTVTQDTVPPAVVAARGSYRLDQVIVSFSELMDPQTATDTANYSFPDFPEITFVGNGVVDPTGTNVILTLGAPLTPGQTYDFTVENVQDLLGRHVIPSTNLPLRAWVLSRGFALEQLYFNLAGGTVADLIGSPKYPNYPDQVNYKTILEGPTDSYDLYGTRLSGWIMPPTDGEYVFYFCSQDAGQLSLSPDNDPAHLVVVAREISWSAARTWTGPGNVADRGNPPSNIATQRFAASQMYAFEALGKQDAGGDNTGVSWKLPSGVVPNNGTPGISGAFLYALAEPVGASVTITQQPTDAVAVSYGAITPVAVLDEDFAANDGGFTVTNYGTPVEWWSYHAGSGSWASHGEAACSYPKASGLNAPAITLPDGGSAVLTFTHRYSFEGLKPDDPTAWDGGQVRVSLNGGRFRTLPPANFTLHGYIAPITGAVTGLLTNHPGWLYNAFVGESPGYTTGTFLTSVANLGYFSRGDTIVIQFVTSWDQCLVGPNPNWEIDSVRVEVEAGVPTTASFTAGASSTYRALPNTQIAYVWQRDAGAGFQDILGAYSSTYTANFDLTDSGTRFRCLVYSPAASATSQVATLTVTLPLTVLRQGSTARLSWPLNDAGFELQRAPALPATSWTTVSPPYPNDGTSYHVTTSVTNGSAFFRLRRP